jgi:mutator protein MutT
LKKRTHKPHLNVAAGLIRHEGKLLITRRPEGSHLAGMWEFPGGKQEGNESLAECLKREIKEELGLDVRAEKPLITVQHEYNTKIITLHLFPCSQVKGTPRALDGQEIRWVVPEDLEKHPFPPPDLKIIKFLMDDKNSCPP